VHPETVAPTHRLISFAMQQYVFQSVWVKNTRYIHDGPAAVTGTRDTIGQTYHLAILG
jgi:hypothetical protein